MKKKSLRLNATLNVIKTVLKIIFPLITYPYVTRVLLVEDIGKVNYANTIVNYFLMFSMLGIPVYSVREGARITDSKDEINKFASEVYSISLLSTLLSMSILICLVCLVPAFYDYRRLIMFISITIPLTTIGTDWVNSIYEDYAYLTIRHVVFHVVALLCLFIFVRSEGDYFEYAFCTMISSCGAAILNVFYRKRYIKLKPTFKLNLRIHFKPIVFLFATSLASMIYSSSDTLMLGLMTNDYHVGIYGTAAKIYNLFKQILFAIIVVALPRFSYMLANQSKDEYQSKANYLHHFVFLVSLPLAVGIFILSPQIIEVIAGPKYYDSIITLRIKSFAILFAIFAYFYMQLILLPARKDKELLICTLFAGVFNVVANYLLIPIWNVNAAAITTVISEFIVMVFSIIVSRKIIHLKIDFKCFFQTILSVIIMSATVLFVINYVDNQFLKLFIGFVTGVIVYFMSLLIMKNEMLIEAAGKLKLRLNKE